MWFKNLFRNDVFDVENDVFDVENDVFDVENVVFDVENVVSKKIFRWFLNRCLGLEIFFGFVSRMTQAIYDLVHPPWHGPL